MVLGLRSFSSSPRWEGSLATGISDSRVAGFTGLTRPLLIFIQGCNLVLPIFVLVSTVRTLVKEKESNIFEYELSFPISLGEYYFSKFLSRIVILCSPLLTAMVLSAVFCSVLGGSIPINIILLYSGLLLASTFFYVSLSFFISSLVRTQEVGLGVSLFIWLLLVALLDVALLGLLIKALVPEETIYTLVLLNPVQLFKIAAICLFDPRFVRHRTRLLFHPRLVWNFDFSFVYFPLPIWAWNCFPPGGVRFLFQA